MTQAMRRLRRPIFVMLAAMAVSAMLLPAAGQAAKDDLDAGAREIVNRVEEYISGIDTLHARFVQSSSNGGTAQGEVWIDRPGKARFEYDAPHPVLMVSNGRTLLYFDREMDQVNYFPTEETPLWFLLREDVDMSDVKAYHVARVEESARTYQVHIVREGVQPGEPGSTELTFTKDPIRLTEWRIVDEQGVVSDIALRQVRYGEDIDPKLFDFQELDLPERIGPGYGRPGP